jgi:hypothetical protein
LSVLKIMLSKEKPFLSSFFESFQRKRSERGILFENIAVTKPRSFEACFYETLSEPYEGKVLT